MSGFRYWVTRDAQLFKQKYMIALTPEEALELF